VAQSASEDAIAAASTKYQGIFQKIAAPEKDNCSRDKSGVLLLDVLLQTEAADIESTLYPGSNGQ